MHDPAVHTQRIGFPRVWKWGGVILACIGLVLFLVLTPGSLLTKADYVGAAVCHRIPSHSFFIDEHQLPLCQRCSGTFPGALTGLLVQWVLWRRRRSQGFPRWPMLVALATFAALWGIDGLNSYSTFLLGRPEGFLGYAPQPWLRLLSGVLMGMGMSAILVPAFNQTLWADGKLERALRTWSEMVQLVVIELAVAGLIYLLEPVLLYPVTLYSVAGVLAMFVCLGAMIFTMGVGRDGTLTRWRDAWVPLVWGLVFGLAVIGVMNGLRLWITGTIQGVPGLSTDFRFADVQIL